MYLKAMSNLDLPDANNSKPYALHECRSVMFFRSTHPEGHTVYDEAWANTIGQNEVRRPFALLNRGDVDEKIVPLPGNAYVLNEAGKTVESFAHAELHGTRLASVGMGVGS